MHTRRDLVFFMTQVTGVLFEKGMITDLESFELKSLMTNSILDASFDLRELRKYQSFKKISLIFGDKVLGLNLWRISLGRVLEETLVHLAHQAHEVCGKAKLFFNQSFPNQHDKVEAYTTKGQLCIWVAEIFSREMKILREVFKEISSHLLLDICGFSKDAQKQLELGLAQSLGFEFSKKEVCLGYKENVWTDAIISSYRRLADALIRIGDWEDSEAKNVKRDHIEVLLFKLEKTSDFRFLDFLSLERAREEFLSSLHLLQESISGLIVDMQNGLKGSQNDLPLILPENLKRSLVLTSFMKGIPFEDSVSMIQDLMLYCKRHNILYKDVLVEELQKIHKSFPEEIFQSIIQFQSQMDFFILNTEEKSRCFEMMEIIQDECQRFLAN